MRARILPLFIQDETSVTVNYLNVEIIMIMLLFLFFFLNMLLSILVTIIICAFLSITGYQNIIFKNIKLY